MPLPTDIPFGYVVGRYALAIADTASDPDALPDALPASGTVVFRPLTPRVVSTSEAPTTIIPQSITTPLADGVLVDQTGREGLWLVAGQYSVTFQVTAGSSLPSMTIEVTDEHTEETPLDLSLVSPIAESPGIKFVVNEQVYLDTLAARDAAIAAAELATGVGQAEVYDEQIAALVEFPSETQTQIDLRIAAVAADIEGTPGPEGPQGPPGADGAPGIAGPKGDPGADGADGADGAQGIPGPAGADGADGPEGPQGVPGNDGADGDSAYEVAVAAGFVGTEVEWLASLVGAEGPQGPAGADGADGAEGPQGPAGAGVGDAEVAALITGDTATQDAVDARAKIAVLPPGQPTLDAAVSSLFATSLGPFTQAEAKNWMDETIPELVAEVGSETQVALDTRIAEVAPAPTDDADVAAMVAGPSATRDAVDARVTAVAPAGLNDAGVAALVSGTSSTRTALDARYATIGGGGSSREVSVQAPDFGLGRTKSTTTSAATGVIFNCHESATVTNVQMWQCTYNNSTLKVREISGLTAGTTVGQVTVPTSQSSSTPILVDSGTVSWPLVAGKSYIFTHETDASTNRSPGYYDVGTVTWPVSSVGVIPPNQGSMSAAAAGVTWSVHRAGSLIPIGLTFTV